MKIREINPFKDTATVSGILHAYQHAFGHAPWNEGFTCTACTSTYPLSHLEKHCARCGGLLKEYWPEDRILHDFNTEMRNPGSTCIVAEEHTSVIGFAWGYGLTINQGTSDKLDAPNLHTLLSGNLFYLDEIAVLPVYQGKGIGRKLMEKITPRDKPALLRTLRKSPMQRLASSLGWSDTMSISKDRVIMTNR
jgi:GNAT superfamily N-acetyltransferase